MCFLTSCNSKEEKKSILPTHKTKAKTTKVKKNQISIETKKNIEDFIPKGFKLYAEEGMKPIKGDLNKDGFEDLVLIIKEINKNNIIQDEYRGDLDRNRRGIIILINKGNHYKLALQNISCFSSENEEGGVYYAPELSVYIEKGNLFVNYAHGRYGYWEYTFKHKNDDFDLIGFDSYQSRGPIPQYEISYNFLTKKKLTRDNLNKDEEDLDEDFKETWEKIAIKNLLKLSEIKDFDDLEF
jgi:hypothetical protein